MTRKISRRRFLGEASCAAVGSSSLFSTLLNMRMTNSAAVMQSGDDYKALVCLFLAGGNDSFNMLVPAGDEPYNEYKNIRADLALAQNTLLPLNGTADDGRRFGLHPSMPEVQELYNNGNLAFVANVGTLVEPTTLATYESGMARLPVGLYSHIDQIAHWQTSVPDKRTGIGWGGRTADLLKSLNDNQNISMNISLAGTNTFQAGESVVEYAIEPNGNGSIGLYGFDRPIETHDMLKKAAIESMLDLQYQNLYEQTFANTTRMAIGNHQQFSTAIERVGQLNTQFGNNEISRAFQMVAKTIAARKTLGFRRQTFFIMFGGWDHHDEVLNNQMAMLSVVSKGLKEFNDALTELGVHNQVTTFTASDFARTLTSNGQGSDHAWGGNHMVMGGAVNGGRIYGDYPSLYAGNSLDTGRGVLIPTLSCDEYFAELADWYGVGRGDLSAVFPNIGRFYDVTSPTRPVGFMDDGTGIAPPSSRPNETTPIPIFDNNVKQPAGSVAIPFASGLAAATAGLLVLRRRRIEELQEKEQ